MGSETRYRSFLDLFQVGITRFERIITPMVAFNSKLFIGFLVAHLINARAFAFLDNQFAGWVQAGFKGLQFLGHENGMALAKRSFQFFVKIDSNGRTLSNKSSFLKV